MQQDINTMHGPMNIKRYIYSAWIYFCSKSSEMHRQACMIFLKLMRNACTSEDRVNVRSDRTVREQLRILDLIC